MYKISKVNELVLLLIIILIILTNTTTAIPIELFFLEERSDTQQRRDGRSGATEVVGGS